MAEEFVSDVSALHIGLTNEDYWLGYQDRARGRDIPPEGGYHLRLPETFQFARSQSGGLKIRMRPLIIVGGEHDGYEIRFPGDLSTTKFKNSNASSAGDVLRNFYTTYDADGKAIYAGPNPLAKEEWQNAIFALSNLVTPHPVYCVWVAWDKVGKTEIKGAKNFPTREDGSRQPFIDLDNGDGTTRRVFANLTPTVRGFAVPHRRAVAA